jgi:hypothetical protein
MPVGRHGRGPKFDKDGAELGFDDVEDRLPHLTADHQSLMSCDTRMYWTLVQ